MKARSCPRRVCVLTQLYWLRNQLRLFSCSYFWIWENSTICKDPGASSLDRKNPPYYLLKWFPVGSPPVKPLSSRWSSSLWLMGGPNSGKEARAPRTWRSVICALVQAGVTENGGVFPQNPDRKWVRTVCWGTRLWPCVCVGGGGGGGGGCCPKWWSLLLAIAEPNSTPPPKHTPDPSLRLWACGIPMGIFGYIQPFGVPSLSASSTSRTACHPTISHTHSLIYISRVGVNMPIWQVRKLRLEEGISLARFAGYKRGGQPGGDSGSPISVEVSAPRARPC